MYLIEDYKRIKAEFTASLKKVALYSLAASFSMLAMPAFLFQVYDRVLMSRSVETLVAMLIIALVILGGYGIFEAVRHAILARGAAKAESELMGELLAAELHRESDARLTTIQDVVTVRQTLTSPVFAAIFDLPMMPLFTIIVFLVHPVLGFLLVIAAIVLFSLTLYTNKKTAPIIQSMGEAATDANKTLENILKNHEVVRANGMYREVVDRWGQKHGRLLQEFSESHTTTQSYAATSKTVRQVIQIALIAAGAALVLADLATPGIIFATSIIGSRALAPMDALLGGWRQLRQGQNALKRLEARLEELSLPDNRTPLPAPKGRMVLERIIYTPQPGTPPIIRGVSATIEAGDRVAIIGPSGAGKSTLARILCGYLPPSAGKVTLDGQALMSWDPVMRGLYMGYMPQELSFFNGTIRENIARLRNDDPALAIDAAKIAGVHEFIVSLPKGYDTEISREGFWPSGGQAALICLARAYYGRPKVLILDEPNASLDTEGEKMFHQSLMRAGKLGMTVILVTHRPAPMPFMNKVMVMEAGQIRDYGPKEDVMNKTVSVAGPDGKIKPNAAASPKPATGAQGKPATKAGTAKAAPSASASKKAAKPATAKKEADTPSSTDEGAGS
ncbi:ABC transporter permease [Kordiimonas sediminis]|uniref:ABC transporter permease n=1 Tax=Kordiimonas sediminis TaxID=1735581 RepID=A0A919APW8_9PROT|nr:type I secretion system permease/ATPase [Kordiimonas sediminis]GHF18485.1 ABC transporter permease [Kordiimonas sediminis]